MKKKLLSCLFAMGAAFSSYAQNFPTAWGNRMQEVLDSVNIETGDVAGVTAALYMPGYGMWTGVAGNSAPGEPMTTDMRVLIGSNSKLFMAVTMLKLQEQGVLSLDDHIGRWITYGPTTVDTTATIRQLLKHESGMGCFGRDYGDALTNLQWADTSAIITARTIVDSSGTPFYPKGRGYHYSNAAYGLCTMIIEEATGQTYWQNLRSLVLDPLNLDSTFAPIHEPYQPIAGTNYEGTLYTGYGFTSFMSSFSGAGDIASTPQEMVQWYQAIFNGQFLADTSLKQLLAIEPASVYGLGIEEVISPRIGGEYYHSGWVGAFTSEAIFDKDTKATLFIAINTVIGEDHYTGQYLAPLLDAFNQYMPKKMNDAGVTALVSPTGITCDASVTPVVTLKNFGSADLTSATIKVKVGTTVASTYNWTGTLATGATTDVTLPATPLTNGLQNVKIYTTQPNGASEGYKWNDTFRTSIGANLTTPYTGYFSEDFEGGATPLLVWTDRNGMEAQADVTKLSGYNSTHSLVRSCVYGGLYGNVSNIDLPAVTLIAGSSPSLSFRYAYKNWHDVFDDSLQALISTDCGDTWTSLFHKGGEELSGGNNSDIEYFPQTAAEWTTETISLAAYTGDALIRLSQYNGNGNNLFIDNITVGAPTSVTDATNAKATMRVYPNPATTQVNIAGLPANTAIRLTDITGKTLIQTITTNNEATVDVSRLTPGIYLISSTFGTTKITKQ